MSVRKKILSKCPIKVSYFLVFRNDKYESCSDEQNNNYNQGNIQDNLHINAENNNKDEKYDKNSKEDESTNDKDDAAISDDDEYGGSAFLQANILC